MGGNERPPGVVAYELRIQRIHMIEAHEEDRQGACDILRSPLRVTGFPLLLDLQERTDFSQRHLVIRGEQFPHLWVAPRGRVDFHGELPQKREGRVGQARRELGQQFCVIRVAAALKGEGQCLQGTFDDFEQQVRLTREMTVDRACGDPAPLGNCGHGGTGKALLGKQLRRCTQDALTGWFDRVRWTAGLLARGATSRRAGRGVGWDRGCERGETLHRRLTYPGGLDK